MPKSVWEDALTRCANPQRAGFYGRQLLLTEAATTLRHANKEQARILAALFSGSQALSELLIARPTLLLSTLNPELLKNPRQFQGLHADVDKWLLTALAEKDYAGALRQTRHFKQQEMLRIAARDLARLGHITEIIQEISNAADICLAAVYKILWQQFTLRYGTPWHLDVNGKWQRTEFCVFGLGKLGGQELNYSSDVDVIFVYAEEGYVFRSQPRKSETGKGMSNHQFFTRIAKEYVAEVSRLTDAGALFRVDVRLRPEGDSGPLVRSLPSYENYYAQWGQTWERMMLIKARCIAGPAALGNEFMEMIQPFRYPRSIGERTLKEISAMKERIETEIVRSGEMERNVKLGYGGIREIEFIVQTHQILQAGRNPFLQCSQTLPSLQNLARYDLISCGDAVHLTEAYCFLRDVEHRLQMENNLQIHTIPFDRKARAQLAGLMGSGSLKKFEQHYAHHTKRVRGIYDRLLKTAVPHRRGVLPGDFETRSTEWKSLLQQHSFREPEQALKLLRLFVQGPGYVHVSQHTSDLAYELTLQLLSYCPQKSGAASGIKSQDKHKLLSDPDRVLARLDSFIQAYGARSTLYETWIHNPSLFEVLILLFDRSEYLAEVAIRTPDLVDELELSGRLRRSKTAAEILADLRFGLKDKDQFLWMRRYHQAEQMRIGLRDILDLTDFESSLIELTALADACLQYALEVILRRHKIKQAPFAIIGLGKLGGCELNYGSDLDIIFVAENKTRTLPQIQKLAVEVMELLSQPTEYGAVFETDARLRPDGEKGLLVNTLKAYDTYYRERAQIWEIQSSSRTRPIAGNTKLGDEFQKLAKQWTNFATEIITVSAHTPDWKQQIAKMRERIEKDRTPLGKDHLAIKTGSGGLMDVEFIAQMFSLENGWTEPNTLKALQRAEAENKLPLALAGELMDNYLQLRRVEAILRRWSFAAETVLPDDNAALQRVAVRCGFSSSSQFLAMLQGCRAKIRRIYLNLLSTPKKQSR